MQYYNQDTFIYLDGEFVKADQAGTDLFGQSLHYGYGAFEGLRAYSTHHGTRIFKAEEHFERLAYSCNAINLPYQWNARQLVAETYQLLEMNNLRAAYIRPLVFSGSNMHLTSATTSKIMIAAWEWGPYLGQNLLRVCTSKIQRPNPKSFRIDAKVSGQYINAILAASDALKNGYDEALLLDQEGHIAQASSENLFIEKDFKLYTAPLDHVFPGITRETVIDICKALHIEVIEKKLTLQDVHEADSAFLCGTAAEIIGIKEVDHITYKEDWEHTIGATIQRKYKQLVLEEENYEVII
ncbi:branched-chain amino acid transaminase [Sphingobacterium psychroaquaticum]|uniref:Branched-chain-amino-acid aminotransferase n=1 Tax=Sphingobacterium psychroaquaticum TaxID=561061 RepID=A0A1X7JBW2_9SPHI|nr:branched-chain amino acid transaminase [Sphingobacterium psychroaquaticum]QBQ39919.1 branched-chain amino acid transaminase [Sphingobacterium psychroaquaticum]SMG25222.1 branched-chain amino acid aminotransferase [Sphingobacterium psychroaquaticum]